MTEPLTQLPGFEGDVDRWLCALAIRVRECLGLPAELTVQAVRAAALKHQKHFSAWDDGE
jgi:hypothetical protein